MYLRQKAVATDRGAEGGREAIRSLVSCLYCLRPSLQVSYTTPLHSNEWLSQRVQHGHNWGNVDTRCIVEIIRTLRSTSYCFLDIPDDHPDHTKSLTN